MIESPTVDDFMRLSVKRFISAAPPEAKFELKCLPKVDYQRQQKEHKRSLNTSTWLSQIKGNCLNLTL